MRQREITVGLLNSFWLIEVGFHAPHDLARAAVTFLVLARFAQAQETRSVEIPTGKNGKVEVAEIVVRLAQASGVTLERPAADLTLSTQGLARALTKRMLTDALGPEVSISFRPATMVMTIDERILTADRRKEWLGRLGDLADKAAEAARHRQSYGMRA